METDFTIFVFDEFNKPVELQVFIKISEEDAMFMDWGSGESCFRPLFTSQIINMKATQNGNPYTITNEDSDDWDSEIDEACQKELSKYVDSRRSA
jgi:hypothetical protein